MKSLDEYEQRLRELTPLSGHTGPESAFVVPDYPYGFVLRCTIRYWIEHSKHGWRMVSQTTNPRRPTTVWNKPKPSTYTAGLVMLAIEERTRHVVRMDLDQFAEEAYAWAYMQWAGENLDAAQRRRLLEIVAADRARVEKHATTREVVLAFRAHLATLVAADRPTNGAAQPA